MKARFYRAIGPGGAFPSSSRREVVFSGRSNVGKSSLLNALTGLKRLARTSKTPGRTREIHFYEQGSDRYLVDLPGYGYARVSKEERRAWGRLVEGYLDRDGPIAMVVILVDARHPPFETDLQLAEALASRGIPFLVALTKTDKASQSERARSVAAARRAFPDADGCFPTSSETGFGLKELARRLDLAVEGGRISGAGARHARDGVVRTRATPLAGGPEGR